MAPPTNRFEDLLRRSSKLSSRYLDPKLEALVTPVSTQHIQALDPMRALAEKPWLPLTEHIRRLEGEGLRNYPELAKTVFGPGRFTAGSARHAETLLGTLSQRGYAWSSEILDNTTLRVHFHHQAKKLGERGQLDLALQFGPYVTGLPRKMLEPGGAQYAEGPLAIKRPQFIQLGRAIETYESGVKKWVPQTGIEATVQDVLESFTSPAVTPEDLFKQVQSARQRTKMGQPSHIWAGATIGDIDPATQMARGASQYELEQASRIMMMTGPGKRGVSVMDMIEGELGSKTWPLKDPRRPYLSDWRAVLAKPEEFTKYLAEARAAGLMVHERGLKPEAVLKGRALRATLGQFLPFGEYFDPTRPMQRLGLLPLVGKPDVPSVSTAWLEQARAYSKGKFTAKARAALIMDPLFEKYVAGSQGGAVVDPEFAKKLVSDVTGRVDWESQKATGKVVMEGGRALMHPDVSGLNISVLGGKQTIATTRPIQGADVAIGWGSFIRGKDPSIVREAILTRVMDQIGPLGDSYKSGSKTARYTEDIIKERRRLVSEFGQRVSQVFGGGTTFGIKGDQPQLLIGPTAQFDQGQLRSMLAAMRDYNRALRESRKKGFQHDLRPVHSFFTKQNVEMAGRQFRSIIVPAEVGSRHEIMSFSRKAVGDWVEPVNMPEYERYGLIGGQFWADTPKGQGVFKGRYFMTDEGQMMHVRNHLFHPRGMKLKTGDIVNLKNWRTKESDQLAKRYATIIKAWKRTEGAEVAKTLGPLVQTVKTKRGVRVPAGFKDFITTEKLADMVKGYRELPAGAVEFGIGDLGGTIFEAGSPLRRQGVAVQLPKGMELTVGEYMGQAGEWIGGTKTRQAYLPALETYQSVAEHYAERMSRLGDVDVYRESMVKAHEKFVFALAGAKANPDAVEAAARHFYGTFGEMIGGKSGFMDYLQTARMAKSGYFSLTPGAAKPKITKAMTAVEKAAAIQEGQWAKKMGLSLPDPYTVLLSETSAKELGVFNFFRGKEFGPKGYMYGRLVAFPSIGPGTELAMRFKMVSDSALGKEQLRLSTTLALLLARDFDADRVGVMFVQDKRTHEYMKSFYKKTVRPTLEQLHGFMADDPSINELTPELKRNIEAEFANRGALKFADIWPQLAKAQDKIQKAEADYISKKFGTKVMTPVLTYFMEPLKYYAALPEVRQQFAKSPEALQGIGHALYLVQQYGAIAKAKASPMETLKGITDVFGREVAFGTAQFEAQAANLSGELAKLLPEELHASYMEYLKTGKKPADILGKSAEGWGMWPVLADPAKRLETSRAMLYTAQMRRKDVVELGKWRPLVMEFMTTKAKKPADLLMEQSGKFSQIMQDLAAQYQATGPDTPAWRQIDQMLMDMVGIGKKIGFDVPQDFSSIKRSSTKIAEDEMLSLVNLAKQQAAKTAPGVVDRMIGWWSNVHTPAWQKAGVITGAAILLGAAAKNMLFPHAAPPQIPPGPEPGARHSSYTHFPSGGYEGPFGTPSTMDMGQKPGGMWGFVSNTVGTPASAFEIDTGGRGMPDAKFNFGSVAELPRTNIHVGRGIAPANVSPMILAGADVTRPSPLPPGIPRAVDGAGVGPDMGEIASSRVIMEPAVKPPTPPYVQASRGASVSMIEAGRVDNNKLLEMLREQHLAKQVEILRTEDSFSKWDGARFVDPNMSSFT